MDRRPAAASRPSARAVLSKAAAPSPDVAANAPIGPQPSRAAAPPRTRPMSWSGRCGRPAELFGPQPTSTTRPATPENLPVSPDPDLLTLPRLQRSGSAAPYPRPACRFRPPVFTEPPCAAWVELAGAPHERNAKTRVGRFQPAPEPTAKPVALESPPNPGLVAGTVAGQRHPAAAAGSHRRGSPPPALEVDEMPSPGATLPNIQ